MATIELFGGPFDGAVVTVPRATPTVVLALGHDNVPHVSALDEPGRYEYRRTGDKTRAGGEDYRFLRRLS